MFKTIKNIVTNENLWKRIIFTLSILLIFRIGHYIKIPYVEITNVSSGSGFTDILNMASTFTAGNFSKACLFSLGVSHYITMNILMMIIQFIAKKTDGAMFKTIKKWSDEGTIGRIKQERLTRILSVLASIVISIAFLSNVPLQNNDLITKIMFVSLMVAGSIICIWLGDLITEKGIGNGISVLMFAGIVARIPTEFVTSFQTMSVSLKEPYVLYCGFAIYVLIYLLFIIFVADSETTVRKINIQSNMKSKNATKKTFPLYLKLNLGGVMPVIIISSIFAYFSIFAKMVPEKSIWYTILSSLSYTNWIGFVVYILLIIIASIGYNKLSFNPEEQAKNLKRSNQVIVGVRQGKDTENYLNKVIKNLSIIGGLCLVIIAGVPLLIPLIWQSDIASVLTFGGTSIIIVVSVALESVKQIKSQLKEVDGFM